MSATPVVRFGSFSPSLPHLIAVREGCYADRGVHVEQDRIPSSPAMRKALRDDDLDDFGIDESESGRITPTPGNHPLGVTSNVGGETIKVFQPLNITEHHFDALPRDAAGDNSE